MVGYVWPPSLALALAPAPAPAPPLDHCAAMAWMATACAALKAVFSAAQERILSSFFTLSFSISVRFVALHSSNSGGSYSINNFSTLNVRPCTAEFQWCLLLLYSQPSTMGKRSLRFIFINFTM